MNIPERVRDVSRRERKSLNDRVVKLTEEVGELAAEALRLSGQKSCGDKTIEQVRAAFKLEAVDVMLMAMDLLETVNATDEEITRIMASQLDKWERQQ